MLAVDAANALRQVLDVDPKCANALYGLGQIRAAQGKHGAARRPFKALVAVEPNAERAWMRLGKSLEAHRRFADAADAYREAIGARPDNAEAHSKLRNVSYRLQKFDEAIAAFDEALRLRPGFLEAEVSRANILHTLARLPAAEWDHSAQLNARLGDAIRANGHSDFAASCYRQAIRLKRISPARPAAWPTSCWRRAMSAARSRASTGLSNLIRMTPMPAGYEES